MNLGFWKKLEKPIMALAPMADVTDVAFRELFTGRKKPDVMFTEFVSTDGLASEGRKNLMRELLFTQKQRPVVAQVWGNKPENFYSAAKLCKKLKFDGIDVNMGCPQRKEISLGACAALIKQPALAKKIIQETMRGAGRLPVSVKTRIGFDKIETKRWIGHLLQTKPAAITVHGRTRKEMSRAPAHWDEIGVAVKVRNKLRNTLHTNVLIIGNGDVQDLKDAREKTRSTGADGVMFGRAAFGNPWLFDAKVNHQKISTEKKLQAMLEHIRLYEKFFKDKKNFTAMRKHFKSYANGFDGARELRAELMRAENSKEARRIVRIFLNGMVG